MPQHTETTTITDRVRWCHADRQHDLNDTRRCERERSRTAYINPAKLQAPDSSYKQLATCLSSRSVSRERQDSPAGIHIQLLLLLLLLIRS
jgi:hypothetical protein